MYSSVDKFQVTIERDFYIRRLFTNIPLLWELLALVAAHRPTLCYCSVLLRAIIATLIHQWSSTGEQNRFTNANNYEAIMNVTIKIIDIMALGQLLPPPLCGIRDIIPFLKCYEVNSVHLNYLIQPNVLHFRLFKY